MTIDEIVKTWKEDSHIEPLECGNASLDAAKLHAKYMGFLAPERLLLKKLKTDYNKLKKQRHEYFMGSLDQVEMKERGWAPNPLKILRADIDMYIDSSQDIIDLTLKIGIQEEKVSTLESVIKTIGTRQYSIKNYIEFLKFNHGM